MTKKLILLIAGVVTLISLVIFAIQLANQKGSSQTELIDFAIEDTSSVDRIIISDPFTGKFEIKKDGNKWTRANGECITQESVHLILEAFKNIEFKGYLPENARENQLKYITTQHIKVEIFENGEWTKTWYIGNAAQDHLSQIMLLESKSDGLSDLPVYMKIKNVPGIISPRFYSDERKWTCTQLLALNINDISQVDVRYFDEPKRSFTVTKNGTVVNVSQSGQPVAGVDTAMVYRYLNQFKKIHFNLANFELDKKGVDSLRKSKPFATLEVKETNGKKTKLRLHRILTKEPFLNDLGATVYHNIDRFWCIPPNGEPVKCQYFVFNPILLGHYYFPLDLTGVAKGENFR